ncbi:sigma-B regulation protein RsbU (phosphoserine phosphatase) [Alkalitalea saponilacus]|uniref:Sigma-B regulation protein RsbU (Phosphoserine phosphatase) n=2 Tax=Alkalitalea saponilacus TaxID=889453 RepID=A0A1T5HU28_9BACT|nr:sigma-B regulation protein RsbU (phosphoserine phosphatase) [Alkalitalea saponilacus]
MFKSDDLSMICYLTTYIFFVNLVCRRTGKRVIMITHTRKRRIRLYKDRLNILLDLAQTINEDHNIEDLLSEFEILLREELDVGKILVYTNTEGVWSNLLNSGVTPEEVAGIDVERDLTVFKGIENITLTPPENLKGFDAIIPLFHRFKAIGYVLIGDVEEEQQGISPTIKHLKLIQIISNLIIVFIENKRMHAELLEQQVMKKELELASRIQNQLIPGPADLPQHRKLAIHTLYHPHYGVGGDYYDFVKLSRNTIGFCVADVSGKGISAALLMSNFQAVIRSAFTSRVKMKKLIHQLNKRVNESANSEKFITIFIGKYNILTRRLSYVNAGHLPPLLFEPQKGHLISLDKGCIGLGMLDTIPVIETGRVTVSRGSKLLAFTDGLVELERGDEITSGLNAVEKIISNSQSIDTNIEEIRKFISKHVDRQSIFDDISVVGMAFY